MFQILFILNILLLFNFGHAGSHCYAQAFSSCNDWGLLFAEVHGLLLTEASLVAEHRI